MKKLRLPKFLLVLSSGITLALSLSVEAVYADSKPFGKVPSHYKTMQHPKPGLSQQQVKKRFGKPHSVHQSAGPVKAQWPRITVWHYSGFSVYFERNRVLHTVRK